MYPPAKYRCLYIAQLAEYKFFTNAFNADEFSRILTATNVNSSSTEDNLHWSNGNNDT